MVKLYATKQDDNLKIYTTTNFVELMRLARKFEFHTYTNFSLTTERYKRCARLAAKMCYGHYQQCWTCYAYEDICIAAAMLRYTTLYVNTKLKYMFFSEFPDAVKLYKDGLQVVGLSKDYENEWGEFI